MEKRSAARVGNQLRSYTEIAIGMVAISVFLPTNVGAVSHPDT
jgi:hypothetical protein